MAALQVELLDHDRRRPLHVIEWRTELDQRLLPQRLGAVGARVGLQLLDRFGQVRLGAAEHGPAGALLVSRQAFLQRLFRRLLQLRMDGRAHCVGFVGQPLHAGDLLRLAAELVDDVVAVVAPLPRQRGDVQLQRHRVLELRVGDDAVLLHAAEHIGHALLRAHALAVGVVVARSLGEAGEEGAFGEREILGVLAEIGARRQLDAPRRAAEEDRVQIDLEDFLLAQRLLDPRGDDHLADFPLVADLVADQEILRHLLRDGRAALPAFRIGNVADEGADHTALVDSGMLEEALVFRRDERLLHVLGDVGELDPEAAVVWLVELGVGRAFHVIDVGKAGHAQRLELVVVGQAGDRHVVELDHLRDVDHLAFDLFLLAELPVGQEQVVELDAAKSVDLFVAAARVGHRGLDQAVEVELLDVERLAHVRAAVGQKLNDLGPVLHRVKTGFDGVWPGGDLAERQGRGKNLDENGFHQRQQLLEGGLPLRQGYSKIWSGRGRL